MADAILKIKTVKHPFSGEEIGFRLQAAVPNRAGGRFDKPTEDGSKVSFSKKYLIAESSDHSEIGEPEFDRFLETLRWQGFKSFEMV